ncbi:hypothetical protein B7486_15295 [cyanobacterium TDX16]|nr:hypothetical protein B7486_15295 [cyanobacterium TDX16]
MRSIALKSLCLSASASLPSRLFFLAAVCTELVCPGCAAPRRAPDKVDLDSGAVVTSADLLVRVVETHRRATSLRALGLLRDFRRGADREVPISWQLARPERCKLQIDMDVAIVLGGQWWTYRPVVGKYTSHRPFTTTPIETAATLISDGVPFLMPFLFNQGAAALGAGADGLFPEWRLKGATFQAGRPCYFFERREPGPDNHGFLRMLIDQESLLLRGWTLGRLRSDGSEKILLEVTYYEIVANATIPRDAFDATPPTPIQLPADAATGESR